jgi:hypothetical protein
MVDICIWFALVDFSILDVGKMIFRIKKSKVQKLGEDKEIRWLDNDCEKWEIRDSGESGINCPECNTVMNTKDHFYFVCPKCCHVLDFRKKFVVFDQKESEKYYFTIKQHDILRNELINTLLQHNASLVYVKPHPRQDVGILKIKLEKYDPIRVIIKNDPAMIISRYCIPIIIAESSVCLDCCRVGSVAIEYIRNEAKGYTYRFQKMGVVAVAHNPDQLVHWVKKLYGFDLNWKIRKNGSRNKLKT